MYNEDRFEKTKEKALTGDANAQFEFATCYECGAYVEKDIPEAIKWYKAAIEKGHIEAQNNLALCYINKCDDEQHGDAFNLLKTAAEQGDEAAQTNLGICYYNGYGVEKSLAEAIETFKAYAEKDNANAQFNLGICYIKEGNQEEASKWLKSASQGWSTAIQEMYGLFVIDAKGTLSTDQDPRLLSHGSILSMGI